MKSKRMSLLLVVACAGLLGATVAVAVTVIPTDPVVSNLGVQVPAVDAEEGDFLVSAGVRQGDVKFLGERAGVRFYIGRSNVSGEPCFMTGLASSARAHFGIAACRPGGSEAFPSAAEPILDYSPLKRQIGHRFSYMQWSAGFAVDAVATIGIIDRDNQMTEVRVTNNIYGTRDVPSQPVKAIVAYDAEGRELYRMSVEVPQDGTTPR